MILRRTVLWTMLRSESMRSISLSDIAIGIVQVVTLSAVILVNVIIVTVLTVVIVLIQAIVIISTGFMIRTVLGPIIGIRAISVTVGRSAVVQLVVSSGILTNVVRL